MSTSQPPVLAFCRDQHRTFGSFFLFQTLKLWPRLTIELPSSQVFNLHATQPCPSIWFADGDLPLETKVNAQQVTFLAA